MAQEKGKKDIEELDKLFTVAKKQRNELEEKLDQIYSQMNFDRKEVKKYLGNSSNFTKAQWKMIQEQKEKIENEIWEMLGKKEKEKKKKKEKEKAAKGRKGKTLGARKGWIPLR